MGTFKIKKLKKYLYGQHRQVDAIVETGTFRGRATRVMASHFTKVVTIELDKDLHKSTKEAMLNEGFNNVEFVLGDSGEVIEKLVFEVKQPAVFFLDAHWSGDDSVNWDKSNWKGYGVNTAHAGSSDMPTPEEQVPLDKEISAIAKNYPYFGAIYIDDMDKFGKDGKGLKNKAFTGEDYSHLDMQSFREMLGVRLMDWIFLGGQLIILFDKIPENEAERTKMATRRKYQYPVKYFFRQLYIHPYLFIRKTLGI